MPVAVVASLLGLVVVLVAYYRDTSLAEVAPAEPDWDLLPAPSDAARSDFPLAFPGYDPATVELHLDRLAGAYADLLAVAPPEVVERARRRAALRLGVDLGEVAGGAGEGATGPDAPPSDAGAGASAEANADAEALRAEAAYDDRTDAGGDPTSR